MKKFVTIKVILIFTFISAVYGGMATIYNFSVSQYNENANLTWSSTGETNTQEFIVQRKTAQTSFVNIATVSVNDSHSYEYQDRSIYKSTGITYSYQIILVDINNPNNIICSSDQKFLIPNNISGIKSTWGSIKAMFR